MDWKVVELERRVDDLTRRVHKLEGATGTAVRPTAPTPSAVQPDRPAPPAPRPVAKPAPRPAPMPPPRPSPPPAPKRAAVDLEDLLGGRVLAWVGGLAVVLGVAFLFAVAVSRGWIGEEVRVLLAGAGSLGLLSLGIWLHERKARGDAALAAVSAGIAGLFVTVTVAAQVYELIPSAAAMALALLAGAAGTALAVRWDSRGIGALGLIGSIAAPILAGAPSDNGTIAILFVACASAVAVTIWRRWDWLSLAVLTLGAMQWAAWLYGPSTVEILVALTAFGLLGVTAAVGYELRVPPERLRASSAFMLALNAVVLAVAGWLALSEIGEDTMGKTWLAGLAVAHLAVAIGGRSSKRVSDDLALLSAAVGVVLADVVFALLADGPVLAIGWAATGVAFAGLIRHSRAGGAEPPAARFGLGTHLALSMLHVVLVDAPPGLVVEGDASAGALGSVLALAAACFASARIDRDGAFQWKVALDVLGLAAVAYLTAVALDGFVLTIAWAIEAVILARIALHDEDDVAACGAAAFLGGALCHALAVVAPPDALIYGLDEPLEAVAALGAVAAAALAGVRLRAGDERARAALSWGAAATLLYLASAAIVTPYQPGGAAELGTGVLDVGVRQQGQMLLSVFWALAGVSALVVGLRRDLKPVRLAALGLLLLTVGKVFLFDLAALTSMYRVVSFIGLGLLLLTGAFVWQRLRPRPLPDLRDAPGGVR